MLDLAGALEAATPSNAVAAQTFAEGDGSGLLEASRGTMYVGGEGAYLTGEFTAFGGIWNGDDHAATSEFWTDQTWANSQGWTGGTWSGTTWSGGTWS